ncbi:MAG: hypothetical protein JO137_04290, partial [Hyphomicrobiales bacterium]|nr:hypothetical protein [Hyphomicrobiales bacterium]
MWRLPELQNDLRAATQFGDVPGVVVVASTADGVVYEAAFGKRDVG